MPPGDIAASTRIGTVFPLLMSSTGRVYGAYLPETITGPLIARELDELAGSDNIQAPRTRQAVEWVFDHRGRVVSAITAFGYNENFDSSWGGAIARALKTTASELSRQRGYVVT